jgi:hypothetical protein
MGAGDRPHASYGGILDGHTNESKDRSSAEKEFTRSPGGDPILDMCRALGHRVHSVYPWPDALFPVYQFHQLERPDPANVGGSSKLYPHFHPGSRLHPVTESDDDICHLQHPSLLDHCLVSGRAAE